ncbi:MAG: hypothetical protein GC190_20430 [Alphaproteobacteria bacterium]|nr:hypothetical protein [Alphaproteobacteria bacterium]
MRRKPAGYIEPPPVVSNAPPAKSNSVFSEREYATLSEKARCERLGVKTTRTRKRVAKQESLF